jgi:hypothetical protein
MTFQPGANVYTQGFGSRPENVEFPHIDVRAPASTDTNYPVGKKWVYTNTAVYELLGFTTSNGVTSANWVEFAGSSGSLIQLTGDTGTAVPTAGSIKIAGTANEITSTASGSTVTLSVPSTFVAPGSITATSGNITATAGNFVSSTAGDGIVLNSGTASGTTTATLNGRSGQITITTPSIAAGATFTFTITNSSVTASTTQVLYGLTGGTTGAAVTIQSVTNSASTSAVVLQNASAVTNNTGSLVLTFLVLN